MVRPYDPTDSDIAFSEALVFADEVSEYLPAFKAFTLNPNPDKYRTLDPVEQYKTLLLCLLFNNNIKHTFTKFYFTPELTQNGNVHIHGYYSIKDPIKYYRWFLPACKLIGFTCVKDRVDDEWTYQYCTKDVELMTQLMEELPVPLTSNNYEENIELKASILRPKYTFKVKNFNIKKKYI